MRNLPLIVLLLVTTLITVKYFFLQQKIEGQIDTVFNNHKILYAITSTDRDYYVITMTKIDEGRFSYMYLGFNNCINHPSSEYCISKTEAIYPELLKDAAAFWEEECRGYHKTDFDILFKFNYSNDYFETVETQRKTSMEINLQKLKIGEYTIHQFRSYHDVVVKTSIGHLIRDILIGLAIILIVSIANKPSRNWIKKILQIK